MKHLMYGAMPKTCVTLLRQSKAFTLLELMVVMAIILTCSLSILPYVHARNASTQLRLAVEQVANEIHLARTLAETYSDEFRVTFYTTYCRVAKIAPMVQTTMSLYTYPDGVYAKIAGNPTLTYTQLGHLSGNGHTIVFMNSRGEALAIVVASIGGRISVTSPP